MVGLVIKVVIFLFIFLSLNVHSEASRTYVGFLCTIPLKQAQFHFGSVDDNYFPNSKNLNAGLEKYGLFPLNNEGVNYKCSFPGWDGKTNLLVVETHPVPDALVVTMKFNDEVLVEEVRFFHEWHYRQAYGASSLNFYYRGPNRVYGHISYQGNYCPKEGNCEPISFVRSYDLKSKIGALEERQDYEKYIQRKFAGKL
jgi:hypothetical protein